MNNFEAKNILLRIINKGGLIGKCGEFCLHDPQKTSDFIIECSEQCHHYSTKRMWGEELVSDIVKYAQSQLKTQRPIIKKPEFTLVKSI